MIRPRSGLLAGALALAAGAIAAPCAAGGDPVPVMIGGEAALDACAIGLVDLEPVPGNTLSVRSGPSLAFERIDRLAPGARVWLCDRQGQWLGVVYGTTRQDCGVATPVAARQPYRGPCRSGWVHERYVGLQAG